MNRRDVFGPRDFVAQQESEQMGHCRSITRNEGLRRDLVERNEDECALGQSRMRNLQIGFTEAKVSHHQDIQVERARAVAHAGGAVASELKLEVEQRVEQSMRGETCFKRYDCVEKPGLVGEAYEFVRGLGCDMKLFDLYWALVSAVRA